MPFDPFFAPFLDPPTSAVPSHFRTAFSSGIGAVGSQEGRPEKRETSGTATSTDLATEAGFWRGVPLAVRIYVAIPLRGLTSIDESGGQNIV